MAGLGGITRIGLSILPRLLGDSSQAHVLYVAWGSAETTITASSLMLGQERQREQFTPTMFTDRFRVYHAFTAITEEQEGWVFAEIGLFDSVVGGNMLAIWLPSENGVDTVTYTLAEGDIVRPTVTIKIATGNW